MSLKPYNASLRNLYYRLRKFKDDLPKYLEDIVLDNEDVIVSAIADDQLYRRGVNGRDEKIMDYAPYTAATKQIKKRKGQPTTRVTLRDTGDFHASMFLITDNRGFYVTASDHKTQKLVNKYGDEIFRLTDKNLTRIIRSHIRKDLVKKLKQSIAR